MPRILFLVFLYLLAFSDAFALVCDYGVPTCNYTDGVGVKCNSNSPIDGITSLLVTSTPTTNYADICLQPANAVTNWQNASGILTTYQYNGATAGSVCTQNQIDNGYRRYRPWTAAARKLTAGECPPPPSCQVTYQWQVQNEAYVCMKYAPTNGPTCNNDPGSVVADSFCPQPKPVFDPPHCSNEVHDEGTEEGQDCGNACSSECVPSCPPGSTLFDAGTVERCVREYNPDNYGNCASMDHYYYPPDSTWPNGFCSEVFDPFLAKEPVNLPALNNPFAKTTYKQTETTKTITQNPDGTTTETTTSTTTGTDANGKPTSDTTTSTKTYDQNGNLIGETSSSTGDKEGSDNADIIAALTGNKEGSLSNLLKAGNAKLDSIQDTQNSGLSNANANLIGIKESIDGLSSQLELKEDIPDGASDGIVEGIGTEGDTALDDMQASVDTEVDLIVEDFDPASNPFPISEGVSEKFKSIFPEPQACTPVTFTSPAGRSLTIECKTFDTARLILAWLLALWTIHTLFEIFINTKPSGG